MVKITSFSESFYVASISVGAHKLSGQGTNVAQAHTSLLVAINELNDKIDAARQACVESATRNQDD